MTEKHQKNNFTIKLNQNIYAGPVIIALATLVGYLFRYANIPETNTVIIYLLAVVAVSIFTQQYIISVLYSVCATLAFNFFFTQPYMAFAINNASYIITFVVMVSVSIIITMLTQRIKKTALIATRSAEENRALYMVSNQLTGATSIDEAMVVCARNISQMCRAETTLIYSYGSDYCRIQYIKGTENTDFPHHIPQSADFASAREIYEKNTTYRKWDLTNGHKSIAYIFIPRQQASHMDIGQQRAVKVIIESVAMAVQRMLATAQQAELQQENERERYRSNLLRAISHDLRTPLSGIMGTGEMIMGMSEAADPRYELAREIIEDADWLHSLMENILNLTKLEDNRYYLKKQPEAVEEIIAVTLERFEKRAPAGRELVVNIPDELILVPVDAKLIVQVLINLIDNSLKHTTHQQEISLSVEKQGEYACFTVADRGTGIAQEDLPHIFQMYYTSAGSSADSKKGMGLGLAICDAVVKAHGGTITAANRADGGAIFTFTLPMETVADE